MKKRMFAFALAMAMLTGLQTGTAFADDAVSLTGDINKDGVVDVSDGVTMLNYLHGKDEFNEDQFIAADIDNDGCVDSLDLAELKYIIIANSGKMPVGSWAVIGMNEDYFYFDGEGNVTVTNTVSGELTDKKAAVNGDKLSITGDDGTREYTVSWVNNNLFDIINENGTKQKVMYYGSRPVEYNQLMNGTWVSDSGYEYHITGVNGYYYDPSENRDIHFHYEKELNRLTFHIDGEAAALHAFLTGVDSMHIDMIWEDGTVERLTKHNVEVIDGITYVNGILIANKTYDLPSTYNPGGILPDAMAAFNEMKAAAWNNDRINLDICSGFRSYSYQASLYNGYVNRDGKAAADTYSARPGHSEHQTGLAMDINNASSSFNNTPQANWLAAHCAEYGFIIRYPQEKQDITGYKYESWHIRYLGKQLAKEVTDSGLTLEEFLCIDSVYKY